LNLHRVLFVCSRNQWRSPTAEHLWRKHPQVQARSAGTDSSARHVVNNGDIEWATHILVMEDSHAKRLKALFATELQGKSLHILDIPDDYRYMDTELVSLLEASVASVLGLD
jgi:predicted protein tyrosine phosphatase